MSKNTKNSPMLSVGGDESYEGYPPCDYCQFTPDYHPWHGCGVINGEESPHIHACNDCKHLLPIKIKLPGILDTQLFTTIDRGSKNYKAGYNAAIRKIAEMNGLKL